MKILEVDRVSEMQAELDRLLMNYISLSRRLLKP